MHIVKNETPLWTVQHLEHYQKYRNVYGMELPDTKIEQELNLLAKGCPSIRHTPGTECFDIYTAAGELVGEIILTTFNQTPEMSLAIFDQFTGRGYALKAVAWLRAWSKNRYGSIEAVIAATNPHKKAVRRMLEWAGFVYQCKLPYGGMLFVLLL